MRKFPFIVFLYLFFVSSLSAFDGQGGAMFMLTDDATGFWPQPIDVDLSVKDPTKTQRVYAEIQCGATPYRVESLAGLKALWWRDSVIPGDTFNLYLVFTTREMPDRYELYSNYGLGFSFGSDSRPIWTIWGGWGPWVPGPSLGIDFDLHIQENGLPPMKNEPALKGDDVVDFLSLMPDIEFKKRNGTLRDATGKKISAGLGDLIGLFDIASIRMSGGLKVDDGHIMAKIEAGGALRLNNGSYSLLDWQFRADTLVLKIAVDSYAHVGDPGWIVIKDVAYYYELYRRIGMVLQSFGQTVASTYWINNDRYEYLGTKTATTPMKKVINIPVTGYPDNSVDIVVSEILLEPTDGHGRDLDRPERDGETGIIAVVCNDGPNPAQKVYFEEIISPDTLMGIEDTFIGGPHPIGPGVCDTVYLPPIDPQTNIGYRPVIIHAYTDTSSQDIDTTNNILSRNVFIYPKHLDFSVKVWDSLTSGDITNLIDRVTLKSPEGIVELAYDSVNGYFSGRVVENTDITVTAIPDSMDTLRFGKSIELNSSAFLYNTRLNIYLSRYGKVAGRVLSPYGSPVDSVRLKLGVQMTTTDSNGYFCFSQVIPAIDTDSIYYVVARHDLFQADSVPVVVHPAESIYVTLQPASVDSEAPKGSIKIIGSSYDGTYTISPNVHLELTGRDDISWVSAVEIKNPGGTWQRFDFSNTDTLSSIPTMTIPWTISPRDTLNEYEYVYARFIDMANNVSDSVMDSILYVQRGPTVTSLTINGGASITDSRDITLSFSVEDSLFSPVIYQVDCDGQWSSPKPYISNSTNCNLSAGDGYKTVRIRFLNEACVWGEVKEAHITLSTQASLLINNGDDYTHSSTVDLNIWGAETYIINNLDSINGNWNYYPVAQTFIPHTDTIRKILLYISVDSPTVVAIMNYDTIDAWSIQPTTELGSFVIESDPGGEYSYTFNPGIPVDSLKSYAIVVYDENLGIDGTEVYFDLALNSGQYTDGKLYYNAGKNGKNSWYDYGEADMAFAIINPPTEMIISNYSDMSGGTGWIPYNETYNNWQLLSGDGIKTVYARVKTGGITLPVTSDRIYVDLSAPDSTSAVINNGAQFTKFSVCTLRVYATDDASGVLGFTLSEAGFDTFYNYTPGYPYTYTFRDQSTGTKNISVTFRDRAGNQSAPINLSIDLDSAGLDFNPLINGGRLYVPSETVSITLQLYKSVSVDSIAFSEGGTDFTPWQHYAGATPYIFADTAGWQQLYVKIKDNHGVEKLGYTQCFIDRSPPLYPTVFRSNEDYTEDTILSYTYYLRGDPESGLDYALLRIYDNTSHSLIASISIDGTYGINPALPLQKYHSYYGTIEMRNRAGLVVSTYPSTLTYYDSPPQPPIIISPDTTTALQPVEFNIIGQDNDPDTVLCFKIDISDDSNFTNIVYSYDGKTNTSGWSKERYLPGDTAHFRMPFEDTLIIGQRYYFRVFTHDSILTSEPAQGSFIAGVSSVEEVPTTFFIHYLSGNPAKGRVDILLGIPEKQDVKVYITDIQGRTVKTLYNSTAAPGILRLGWKGVANSGNKVRSGIYFLAIKTRNNCTIRKIVYMRN